MSVLEPIHHRADLQEAKDLHAALSALALTQRIKWLRLCCAKVSIGQLTRLDVVSVDDGSVLEMLTAFYSICGQNGLTLEWATALAEHQVRGNVERLTEFLQGV